MRYRYYYCSEYSKELEEYLQNEQIKYRISASTSFIIFNIWSSDKDYKQKMLVLEKWNRFGPSYTALEPSASDLKEAKYLTIRPKKQSITIINEDASFAYLCQYGPIRRHEKQIGEIYIRKEPNTDGNTAFWCEDTGFSDIFVSRKVRDLVGENELSGISFLNVRLKKNQYCENLFQMTSLNVLKHDQLVFGYEEREEICPRCGKIEYDIGSDFQLHVDFSKVLEQSDLYITEDKFGGSSLYIISQRFYRAIIAAKLDKNVAFLPVVDTSYA